MRKLANQLINLNYLAFGGCLLIVTTESEND
jgi:hypothetical protein